MRFLARLPASIGGRDLAVEQATTGRWAFDRGEWARLGGFFGSVGVLHALGWGLFLYYHNRFGPIYAGAGALAYTLGLRHAFDADHISAIDDTTRFLMQKGKRPLGVGFFFSLGHSTVVFALSLAIALAAQAVSRHIDAFSNIGGTIGAMTSIEKILKCPVLFLGLSLPEHGYHAPNENFDWQQASGGMVAFAKYFEEIANLPAK